MSDYKVFGVMPSIHRKQHASTGLSHTFWTENRDSMSLKTLHNPFLCRLLLPSLTNAAFSRGIYIFTYITNTFTYITKKKIRYGQGIKEYKAIDRNYV